MEDKKKWKKIQTLNKIRSINSADSLDPAEDEELDDRIPDPILWSELNSKEFPKDRWYIENLVPKYGATILAAVTGERKTWLALQMTKSIISGEDFLGKFKTQPGNVLYVDSEMSEIEFQRRGRQLQIPLNGKYQMHILNKGDINLNSPDGIAYLYHFINHFKISVVFLDTLRSVSGGIREEKAEEVRSFFDSFKDYKNSGTALVWADHFRKPSRWEGNEPKKEYLLGSQDKTANCEVLLMLKSDDKNDEISVYQTKNRTGNIIKPFKIKMADTLINEQQITEFLYLGEIEEKEQQKEKAKSIIINLLLEDGNYNKEIVGAVYESARIGKRNAQEALRELIKEKKIECVREGKKYYYFIPKEVENDPEIPSSTEDEENF